MRSTSGVQIIGFDHIRAFAALLVFMWHFMHPPFGLTPFGQLPDFFASSIFNEGHTGVALFMTLSGFIFSFLSFGKDIDLKQFYINRFLRVFPLLFFWCIFWVAFQNETAPKIALNLFTLLDNRQMPAGGWTVIVEIQFYLLFPFIHPIIEKKYHEKKLWGVFSYVIPFLIFTQFLRWGVYMKTGSAQTIAYWTIFGRVDQFLLGVLTFYIYRSVIINWSSRKSAFTLTIISLLFLSFYRWFNSVGGYYKYDSYPSSAIIWIIIPTIEGIFYGLFISLYLNISQNFHGKLSKLLSYIGTLSYSIYLSNFFMIPILEHAHSLYPFTNENTFGEYFSWGIIIGFPAICIFSLFTYYYVEHPFLERRKRYISTITKHNPQL
ncbi:acyltransferase family protein [Glaciimonas soli]|uniref:Acyltransferase family protein n=1 Tax=Glaciimonas soli TaxID=2590999 RepID=A0A843YVI4_9BURK|nr:acyltransferase [Glaciimonas soli]MQR01311.1 acyltransferase family protein [Glaciimonas soli]